MTADLDRGPMNGLSTSSPMRLSSPSPASRIKGKCNTSESALVWDRAEYLGYNYNYIGENLAGGQLTVEDAMAGLLDSPGHCANIMNPHYTEFGSAIIVNDNSLYVRYWTQVFGKPLQ